MIIIIKVASKLGETKPILLFNKILVEVKVIDGFLKLPKADNANYGGLRKRENIILRAEDLTKVPKYEARKKALPCFKVLSWFLRATIEREHNILG
jgi:hypothetical protein